MKCFVLILKILFTYGIYLLRIWQWISLYLHYLFYLHDSLWNIWFSFLLFWFFCTTQSIVLYTSCEAMRYCDRASLGLAIASLSVVFYFIGAIFYIAQIVQLKANSHDTVILQTIFLIICLVMSIVSALLIFGIVEVIKFYLQTFLIVRFVFIYFILL